MNKFSKYVGLDTHKDIIAVAVSDARGGDVRYYGEIPNQPKALAKLLKTLTAEPWSRFVMKPALWLWDLSTPDGAGPGLCGGGLIPDSRETRGSSEN